MARLSNNEQRALVDELVSSVKRFTPEWTAESSDPGIAIIELLAWLGDVLASELDQVAAEATIPVPPRGRLRKLLQKLTGVGSCGCDTSGGLTRNRYFTGRLLTAADFQVEQDYFRRKMRIHNRCLFGSGVVTGLEVTLDHNDADVVIVEPGCAIDDVGEDLLICEPLRCALKGGLGTGYVSLSFCEQAVRAMPGESQEPQEPSRIEEGVCVEFGERAPERSVVIARLKRKRGKWMLDNRFRPAKVKFGR
jgi:hypothetical protein